MEGFGTGEYSDRIQEKFRQIFDPEVEFVFTAEDVEDMNINSSVSDYVWLPLKFDGEQVRIEWREEWTIEEYE